MPGTWHDVETDHPGLARQGDTPESSTTDGTTSSTTTETEAERPPVRRTRYL